jgi:predicted transcriptional regulator
VISVRTKRDRIDIMRDILDNVGKGRNTVSALMKYVGLSALTLRTYLTQMSEKGLIAESDKGYVLTEKGRRVLELLKEATSLESRLMYIMAELARDIEEV